MNVEELVFGGVTNKTAKYVPTDVGRELSNGDATDNAGDLETPEGPAAGSAGEQPYPGETETSQDLREGLSIKGGSAIIGVQQPSADPHTESFDDPDLFGLAHEFPAMVARVKARWEEEPMHPAHVKPTPRASIGTGASRLRARLQPPREELRRNSSNPRR